MYEKFAAIYDEMMSEIPYDEWFEKIHDLLLEYGIESGHVCELGCGTGEMVRRLADAGYEVTGIDISPNMLALAAEKTQGQEKVHYFEEDMTDFSLHKMADVVLCICDSMNYLLREEDLLAMFRCIRENLVKGGICILDMKTAYCFQKVMGNQVRVDETEDALMIWDNTYEEETHINEYILTMFVEEKETGMYERYDECHEQRAYSSEEIQKLAEQMSLQIERVWTEDKIRTYFVLKA
ncbi:MAG: class I SAM-dependent methyltransferase [Eubacterium sp.]|nr:class I SAM-dependent methyltransferase [Eubacterium sp.]